ncbi:MAG: sigma 54-interacting transcriptional regulator, partial [Candidatus Methylomirabilaceae bacterium]
LGPIAGASPAIKRVIGLIGRFAPTTLPILIVGATGTGKELVARHIHRLSRRRDEFVDVNCGALPREMVESLLFGHRKGAFTGAIESAVGYVERSNRGTMFLDEVSSLPPEAQVKLLRVLESSEVQPLGDASKRLVDLRVIAAAQNDITGRLASAAFRRDLYQRLAGVVIALPPLADRPEDVLPLARLFADRQGKALEPAAERLLVRHSWPGNVRELRQVIDRAGWLVEDGTLTAAAVVEAFNLGEAVWGDAVRAHGEHTPENAEPIVAACAAHGWHAGRTAAALGIARSTLWVRLQRLGISLRETKRAGIVRRLFEQS